MPPSRISRTLWAASAARSPDSTGSRRRKRDSRSNPQWSAAKTWGPPNIDPRCWPGRYRPAPCHSKKVGSRPSSTGWMSCVGSRRGFGSRLTAAPARLMGWSAPEGGGTPSSRQAFTTCPRNRASNSAASSVEKSSPYHQYQSEPSAAWRWARTRSATSAGTAPARSCAARACRACPSAVQASRSSRWPIQTRYDASIQEPEWMEDRTGSLAPATASVMVTVSSPSSAASAPYIPSRKARPESSKCSQGFSPSRNTPIVAGPSPPSERQASPASRRRERKSATASGAGVWA